MNRILVVEDDPQLNNMFSRYLRSCNYEVVSCTDPILAFDLMSEKNFDIILSDIMMPQLDGFELAEAIRNIDQTIPILFITARDDFASKRRGFRIGIDDYMVKPVDLDELELRVEALLRRANINRSHVITIGDICIDQNATTLEINQEEIPVTLREFNILYKLLSYPNQTFSRAQLMDEFWSQETDASLRAVDVYITRLRDKCAASSTFSIKTVHGLGYKGVIQ